MSRLAAARPRGTGARGLVWHPDFAADLVDEVDPDGFCDPVLGPIAGELVDVYRAAGGNVPDPVALRRDVRDVYGLDRPDGVPAAVWGPAAVAEPPRLTGPRCSGAGWS